MATPRGKRRRNRWEELYQLECNTTAVLRQTLETVTKRHEAYAESAIPWPPYAVTVHDEILYGGGYSVFFDRRLVARCASKQEVERFIECFMAVHKAAAPSQH